MKSINSLIGQIMSLPCYQNFSITTKYSCEDCYLMEMVFTLGGYSSFTLLISSIDSQPKDPSIYEGWSYVSMAVALPRVAPDWEAECDTQLESYEAGNAAEKNILEGLEEFCDDSNLCIDIYTKSRWSHSDLCSFYPDRPEIMDIPWA